MGSALVFTLTAGAVVTPALMGGKDVQMLGQTIYELRRGTKVVLEAPAIEELMKRAQEAGLA